LIYFPRSSIDFREMLTNEKRLSHWEMEQDAPCWINCRLSVKWLFDCALPTTSRHYKSSQWPCVYLSDSLSAEWSKFSTSQNSGVSANPSTYSLQKSRIKGRTLKLFQVNHHALLNGSSKRFARSFPFWRSTNLRCWKRRHFLHREIMGFTKCWKKLDWGL
jgi:hypothetical protein